MFEGDMVSAGSTVGITYARRFDVAEASDLCVAPRACVDAVPMESITLLLTAVIATVLVSLAFVHIGSARSLIEEERERTRAERNAFDAFSRRVAALDVAAAEATIETASPLPTFAAAPPDGTIEGLKEEYRDTVMAVPHYENEYDEPLEANMTAELGPELAAAVAEEPSLTPHLKAAFVRRSKEAVSRREQFLARLDREVADLEDAETVLSEVESDLYGLERGSQVSTGFDDLVAAWHRIRAADERCRSLLADRQRTLHDASSRAGEEPSLQEYLYRQLDVDHPILAAGADLASRADRTRSKLERAIAGRV